MNSDLKGKLPDEQEQTAVKDPETLQFIDKLLVTIQQALEDKQADNVETIRVTGRTSLTDYFIVATARNSTHCKILSDAVEAAVMKKLNYQVRQVEGMESRKWIVLDYGDIIVHVMRQEDREFYNLEKLWQNSKTAK
ncbi:MAG: ribosome silencing factor [Clostridiaceae bacterium]|nr:ribosome silencing factor [Clostridiaceae bacterium]